MAGNDSDKTVRDFLKQKCTRENFENIFKTLTQQCSWQKTFAWTVANAKFGLGIMLIFMFKPQLESWYSLHVAEPYLDITGWQINELLVFLLAGAIIGYGVIRACFGAVVSGKQAVWTVIALSVYAYYRLCHPLTWIFAPINATSPFTFADLFALYGGVIVGRWIVSIFKTEKKYEGGFHYDEPLSKNRETGRIADEADKLGRTGYAKQIAETIIQTRSKDAAFAMGITGSWGSGKTSFWRLIENQLRTKRDIIIIEYRPWQNHGSGVIVKDFFAVLSQRLRPYDSSLSGTVDTYTKILLDADDSTLNKIVKPIRSLFCADSTAATEFDRINAALRRIDKQIVIFIDDLDRLDKNEVLDVIRLIRNTANFANVFFVAAYDRGYIMQALEDFNRYNKEAFLEKIFQLEVPLPKFEHRRIIEHLETTFIESQILTENDLSIFNKLFFEREGWEKLKIDRVILPHVFVSMRDVNRFANLFLESYKPLKDDINIQDLFYVELLKYKYQSVYEIVFVSNSQFIETSIIPNENDEIFVLKKTSIKDHYHITNYCQQHCESLGILRQDIPFVVDLLKIIFPEKEKGRFAAQYPTSFLRYGSIRLSENNISFIKFQKIFESDELPCIYLLQDFMGIIIDKREIENFLFFHPKYLTTDLAKFAQCQIYYLKIEYQQNTRFERLVMMMFLLDIDGERKNSYLEAIRVTLLESIPTDGYYFETIFIISLIDLRTVHRNGNSVFTEIYLNNLLSDIMSHANPEIEDSDVLSFLRQNRFGNSDIIQNYIKKMGSLIYVNDLLRRR